jgi:hypothetical protein
MPFNNMEQELVVGVGNGNDEEEEEDRASRETPRQSFDSTSSSSKKCKKWKENGSVSNDPLLDMFNEVSGDLKVVTNLVGKMAQAMEHEATIQEKAMSEVLMQKLRERAVNDVRRLEFTGLK